MYPSPPGVWPGVPPQNSGYVTLQGEPRRHQGAQQVPLPQFHHQLVGRQQMHPWQISQLSHSYNFHQPSRMPIEGPFRNPRLPLPTANNTPAILPTSPLGQVSPSLAACAGSTFARPGSVLWTPPHLSQRFNIPDLHGVTPQTPLQFLYQTPVEQMPPPFSLPASRYRDPDIHRQDDFTSEHQQRILGNQYHVNDAVPDPQYHFDTHAIPRRQNPPNTLDSQTEPGAQYHGDITNRQSQQNIIDRGYQSNRQYQQTGHSTQLRQDSADTQNRPVCFDVNRSEGIRNHNADHRREDLHSTTREPCSIGGPVLYPAVPNRINYFVKIAQKHPHIKYNGFYIENGFLEIGRLFKGSTVDRIKLGLSRPIRRFHEDEDLSEVFDDLDKEGLRRKEPMTIEEAIAPGTLVLAVSYRHHRQNKEGRPNQKMSDGQKADLRQALVEIFDRQKPQRILLWIDQAWTKRIKFRTEDWLGSGILAYFAFDVLLLERGNDPNGLWLYLERKIAEADSKVIDITPNVKLFEKCFEEEPINNITFFASKCTGDKLNGKRGKDEDKSIVRGWAENFERTYIQETPSQDLSMLSRHNNWKDKVLLYPYGDLGTSFAMKIENYIVCTSNITWCEKNRSTPWNKHAWSGLAELMGNKNQTLPPIKHLQLEKFLELLDNRFVFKVFLFTQRDGPRYLAIGRYKRFIPASRIILCHLSGCENSRDTFVIATCLIDVGNFSPDVAEFLPAFHKLTPEFWETVDDKEAHLKKLLSCKRLLDALQARGFETLHDYIGTIQPKDLKFSVCLDR